MDDVRGFQFPNLVRQSPVLTSEMEGLMLEGIEAYLDGDYAKAVHVLIPQIEAALRNLLSWLRSL